MIAARETRLEAGAVRSPDSQRSPVGVAELRLSVGAGCGCARRRWVKDCASPRANIRASAASESLALGLQRAGAPLLRVVPRAVAPRHPRLQRDGRAAPSRPDHKSNRVLSASICAVVLLFFPPVPAPADVGVVCDPATCATQGKPARAVLQVYRELLRGILRRLLLRAL